MPAAAPAGRLAQMTRALLLCSAVALLAAGAATAATPAQYRTHLNGICRSYTPKLKQLESAMAQAQKAKDAQSYGVALGQLMVTGLAEDMQIERVAIPAALQAQVGPLMARLKVVDGHVRAALLAARAGDAQTMAAELKAVGATTTTLNAKFDAAGLRDCGSNQQ